MKRLILVLFFLIWSFFTKGQIVNNVVVGEVNFITTQNVYARFPSTSGISAGDTLFAKPEGVLVPMFVVEHLSSVSCSGKLLNNLEIKPGSQVVARVGLSAQSEIIKKQDKKQLMKKAEPKPELPKPVKRQKWSQTIDGRISALSYLSYSNSGTNEVQRLRYNLSLHANHLGNTGFSVESYLSFNHNLYDWKSITENVFNGLKIYNLSASYAFGPFTQLWIGRKINQRVSNIGAVDGLQMEAGSKNFFIGAIAGYRPDYTNYGLNTRLPEYGAYLGYQFMKGNRNFQTSFAFFRQTNQGKTDRQFIYFQQSNTLIRNLRLFFSGEIDLFQIQNNQVSYRPGLTSLYFSLGYQLNRKFWANASYDARKNVIYYETFKSMIDQLLEDATRQGVNLRLTYRPTRLVMMGLSGGYRFLPGDLSTTQTLYGYLAWQKTPFISIPLTLSANWISNGYMDGLIYSVRSTKDFFDGKLTGNADLRYVNYQLTKIDTPVRQIVGELGISYQISRKLSFSVDYEGTFEAVNRYHRVFMNLSQRF